MLKIILCDDDPFILKIIREQVERILSESIPEGRIACVASGYQELFLYLKKHPGEYLFFLDLDFGSNEFNGIDIAKQIKKNFPGSKIVFVTNHYELALNVLKSGVEPFGFIEKTTDIMKMNQCCYQYIYLAQKNFPSDESEKDTESVTLKIGTDEELSLPKADILYVEAVKTKSHCICYHTVNGSSITVRETIDHALETLGEGFMKSHRSVIVQKCHMISLSDGMVKFINGDTVPCSFRQRNEIKGVIYGKQS